MRDDFSSRCESCTTKATMLDSPGSAVGENLPASAGDQVCSLVWGDPKHLSATLLDCALEPATLLRPRALERVLRQEKPLR